MSYPRRIAVSVAFAAGLLVACHAVPAAASSPAVLGPVVTVRAALNSFNSEDCAQIYALTAPWDRGPQPAAATIAACRQGFIAARREGVMRARLTLDGMGHAIPPAGRAYRQPVLLHKVVHGQASTIRETLQLVHAGRRWYVEALW